VAAEAAGAPAISDSAAQAQAITILEVRDM
jgi:hypothetical protein